jgi:predicted AAA+ superfamily ATPase
MVSSKEYLRPQAAELLARLDEPRRFLQVIAGARQVGKTTLATQVAARTRLPLRFASADEPTLRGPEWLEAQWEAARLLAGRRGRRGALLVLDEVQKVSRWAEIVKRLWDEDTRRRRSLKVVLLGSAPLLVQRGLTESLAGRFEILRLPHWSFLEMRQAFGYSLERYVFYGAYPGAAPLVRQPARWSRYIQDALIETTIARDVLLLSRVDKPALLRRLFELGCRYSGQVLSYTKMVGQLQDAGNTTTLAHYLDLLAGAGMLTGLQKYAGGVVRRRASSPKLQVCNTALMTAPSGLTLAEARADREFWGRLVESAVGAHLVNASMSRGYEVYYWRDRNREVDFVVRAGRKLVAIEVKTGRTRDTLPGMAAFADAFRVARKLLVGADGIPLEEFLSMPAEQWVEG